MNIEEVIEEYNSLREKCLKLAKANNGALMGSDAWLCYAIMESDITLDYSENGIHCNGSTYTSQTMCSEPFGFVIPFEYLKESNA